MKSLVSLLILTFFVQSAWGLQILNSKGEPVAGASVMIGQEAGNPFADNIYISDENGNIPNPKNWSSDQPVSVDAEGYVRATYMAVSPSASSIVLKPVLAKNNIEVKGQTTDYGRLRRDGNVDFGLVLPALSREELLQFDVTSVVSTEMDMIKIINQKVHIPSNIALPKQKETYFLPITLNKPAYRVYLKEPGNYRITATHGQFPLKKVVDELRGGKSFFDVLNHFNFIGGGETEINVTDSVNGINVPVNQNTYDTNIAITAPNYDSSNSVMLSVGLIEKNGQLVPTDLKKLSPNESLTVKTSSQKTGTATIVSVLSGYKPKTKDLDQQIEQLIQNLMAIDSLENGGFWDDEDGFYEDDDQVEIVLAPQPDSSAGQVSANIQVAAESNNPTFLPLIEAPLVTEAGLSLTPPAVENSAIKAFATYVILSEIESLDKGKYTIQVKHRRWEVLANGWVDQISLPKMANLLEPNKKYSWEVLYLGTELNINNEDLRNIDGVTHLTRNSASF